MDSSSSIFHSWALFYQKNISTKPTKNWKLERSFNTLDDISFQLTFIYLLERKMATIILCETGNIEKFFHHFCFISRTLKQGLYLPKENTHKNWKWNPCLTLANAILPYAPSFLHKYGFLFLPPLLLTLETREQKMHRFQIHRMPYLNEHKTDVLPKAATGPISPEEQRTIHTAQTCQKQTQAGRYDLCRDRWRHIVIPTIPRPPADPHSTCLATRLTSAPQHWGYSLTSPTKQEKGVSMLGD